MLTAQQKELRMSGIGGSDTATILGLNPYKTAFELWLEKCGEVEAPDLDDNDAVKFGNILEDPIAKIFTERTGKKVRKMNKTLRSEKYPWLLANIDRKIEGKKEGLEIKNVGGRMFQYWGKDGTDEVAEYYLPQPHHYMLVLDYRRWDLAAFFGGSELRIYDIGRDKEMDELIIDRTHDFWFNHVQKQVAPPIDFSASSLEDLIKRMYKATDGEPIELPEEMMYWHQVKRDADNEVKRYQGVSDAAKHHIALAMENHAVGVLPDGTGYTRNLVKRAAYMVDESEYVTMRFTKKPKVI